LIWPAFFFTAPLTRSASIVRFLMAEGQALTRTAGWRSTIDTQESGNFAALHPFECHGETTDGALQVPAAFGS
jgi:hypothetical protein